MAMDWDAMLEYKTVKIVVIRDRRLGIIHYAVMLLILIYVVVYTIVFEGGYLKTEPPFGSARATLRQPDTLTSETVLPYCLQNSPTSTLSDGSSSPNELNIGFASFSMLFLRKVNSEERKAGFAVFGSSSCFIFA
eukprot:TRINITY_DN1938_c0_g1_i2.p1 TRINITY_DN1938_c0_g1~~TRINITY_DN1938_c0_g1_i2.p1  ORF type:complete len:135 (+),score=23.15 TRINITY_DN1938_c0_g1_i2:111-515(+)